MVITYVIGMNWPWLSHGRLQKKDNIRFEVLLHRELADSCRVFKTKTMYWILGIQLMHSVVSLGIDFLEEWGKSRQQTERQTAKKCRQMGEKTSKCNVCTILVTSDKK